MNTATPSYGYPKCIKQSDIILRRTIYVAHELSCTECFAAVNSDLFHLQRKQVQKMALSNSENNNGNGVTNEIVTVFARGSRGMIKFP